MRSPNITELKNRLSHYLGSVRRGETILLRDRNRVIARIEPAGEGEGARAPDAERLAALEERGVLRRAEGPLTRGLLARRPRVRADVVAALLREREETR